jgi:multiple sugar transport system permease protein
MPARIVMLGTLAMYGVPGLFMVMTSLRTNSDVYAKAFDFHFSPTLNAYKAVGDYDVTAAVWSSVRITGLTTVLVLVLGVPAAYSLARMVGRPRSLGLASLILLQLLPASTLVIPLYQVLRSLGLLGSVQGVIFACTAYYLPFAVILLRPFFLGVPLDIENAALIDGASRVRIFWQIVLPLARNGVVTVGVLVAMIVWGDFLFALTLLVNPTDYPLSTLLAQQVSDFGINWPRLMALAIVAAAPIVALFLVMERRLSSGLSVGGVK